REEVGKPLRHCENYLNEISGILGVFGLEKSPDHTTFHSWDKEFSARELRSLLRRSAEQAGISGTGAAGSSGSSTTRLASSIHFSERVTLCLISPEGVQVLRVCRYHPLPSTDSTRPFISKLY